MIKIANNCVLAEKSDGTQVSIGPVDSVVVALGARSEQSLKLTLEKLHLPFSSVGDCLKPGNVLHATATALDAVMKL